MKVYLCLIGVMPVNSNGGFIFTVIKCSKVFISLLIIFIVSMSETLLKDIQERLIRIEAKLDALMGEEEVSEEFAEELKEIMEDMEKGNKIPAEKVLEDEE